MRNKFLKFFLVFIAGVLLTSCGSSRSAKTSQTDKKEVRRELLEKSETDSREISGNSIAEEIVSTARDFEGTRYKFGGTDKRGMDCSGLIYVAFLEQGISLPRTSRDMSLLGDRLFLENVAIGDLLFFETNKNRKVINHVGLVIKVTRNDIFFIHSSTSQGVIISSLSESYWNRNFVMAKRVI